MKRITRRGFINRSAALSAFATLPGLAGRTKAAEVDAQTPSWSGGDAASNFFRLSLSPREGLKGSRLVHLASGLDLARADYSYSFGRPEFQRAQLTRGEDGSLTIHLAGAELCGNLEIQQEFRLPYDKPWVEEQITLVNRGSMPLNLPDLRCGFVLPLPVADGKVTGDWREYKFIAIPYRREPQGSRTQYFDFTMDQILTQEFRSELITFNTTVSPAFASEGWAWTNGTQGFLLTKYGMDGMEWAMLDGVPLQGGQCGLRWGGIGTYLGEPVHGARLEPGATFRFGITRLTAYQGGMLEGFQTFRKEMTERGHGCPPGFDPPVHWNELYDNKLWWLPDDQQGDPENRKKYYTLDSLKEEAAKARAIGCQALYLDPGWDTRFASKIWDESRLGPCKAFVEMLRRDYDLKLSLHTPLSGWCDPTAYPQEMYRMDRFGQRLTWEAKQGFGYSPLCGAAKQYIDETARRLNVLAVGGVTFFMFDGDGYHGECWDPGHGHRVPALQQEHVEGRDRLARMVHAEHPDVLIEMHWPTPTYYGHGRAPANQGYAQALGFDSVWGFELMWGPMRDLISGHAMTLYYYSLACGIPIYLHIDLRKDNANALMLWWNASTCRHLGIGGTHADPTVRHAQHQAMATYRRLERFFKAGDFYGLDEMTHIHIGPEYTAAIINCFNLDDHQVTRLVVFEPGKYGLDAGAEYRVNGAAAERSGMHYNLNVTIAGLGHTLVEVMKG